MVFETVRRARRRILANEAMRHAAYAVSAALGSLIVLLLVGTQILNWGWLLLLPSLTLATGVYGTWRHIPSLYQAAQRVDFSLGLADTLSTALFFTADGRAPADVRRAQWVQAESVAAGVDLRRGIPLRMPRAIYTAALLALTAGSLFALRYGLDRRLDLSAPLARVVQDKLGHGETRQAARDRKKAAPRDPKRTSETGLSLDDSQQKSAGELDAAQDSALESPGVPDVDNKSASRPDSSKLAQSTQLEGGENQSEQPDGMSANPGNEQSADAKQGQGAGKPEQGDDKQGSGNPGENSGLLGKFKDAMSSLMNRMRQQQGAKGGQQQQAGAQGGQQKNQQANAGQNGKPGQQPGDGQQADAKDGQPGDDSQNAQSSQPGSPGENGQQPATKQPGSGIGRQDGSKDVKLAEQLAAMGKISEIIGKRAANVSGELTVEVQNSNQQLHTPYAQRTAHHAEAGGEINRDEVPVALQAYVEQYFEQVRKQAPTSTVTPAARGRHRPEPPKPGL
jgi:hypothetical protein